MKMSYESSELCSEYSSSIVTLINFGWEVPRRKGKCVCSYNECNVTSVTLDSWDLAVSRGKHTATDNAGRSCCSRHSLMQ